MELKDYSVNELLEAAFHKAAIQGDVLQSVKFNYRSQITGLHDKEQIKFNSVSRESRSIERVK